MAGLTTAGFEAPSFADILVDLQERWNNAFGNADLSPESPDGMLVGIFAERMSSLIALAELVYSAGNVDSAVGAQLDEHAALSGVRREPASSSTVTLVCAGTAATSLPAGQAVILDNTQTRWLSLEDATIGVGGTIDVPFAAEDTGPLVALAGSDWTIDTPITGWTGVSNALDAEVGQTNESDASLRTRRRRTFIALGDSADSVRAAILRIDGVLEAFVVENEGNVEDAEGRPPKSFEVIVRGGEDQDIVDTIWTTKPLGIETYGTGSGVATDSAGRDHTIFFTRPTEIPIWIELDITTAGDGFPSNGLELIRDEVLTYEASLAAGSDVIPWQIERLIETEGIVDLEIRIGLTSSPTSSVALPISSREIATLDSSRITVRRI